MLSLLIALAAGIGVMLLTSFGCGPIWGLGPIWGSVCGLFAVVLVQLGIGLWIRRKVNAVNAKIQALMEEMQRKVNRKIQMFQQRPVGSVKMAQQMLEKDQAEALRAALVITDEAAVYYKWNILLKKQINTLKMQLYFQLREFDKVDELLPRSMFMDARSIAVKMVRMFRKDDPGLEKFYRKKSKRMKGDDLALLASTYSFMQIKRGDADGALKTLIDAKKRTDNPVIIANWEHLVNGKVKQFSNAGLGDNWYSLYLEEPKIKPQRVQQQRPF